VRHQPGNGSSKVIVHQTDMGGWVRIYTDRPSEGADDLPVFLSHALTGWFRERPQLRMRCAVPIQRNGQTVELHAWFDLGVFPDVSGQQPKKVD
jgi:hypothetical protein